MLKDRQLYACLLLGLLGSLIGACVDTSVPNEAPEETVSTVEEGNSTVGTGNPEPGEPALGELEPRELEPRELEPGELEPEEQNSSEVTLVLDGDGFQLTAAQVEEAGRVIFGESIESAMDAASVVFGQPAITAAPNTECPAGPMEFTSWGNGFTLNAMNGEWVGWSVRSHNAATTPLSTDQGISIGTSRETLETAYSTTVEQTTLGTEFYTDGALFGILSSDAPDATVEYLWAGTSCSFR